MSTHTALLDIPTLPLEARKAHIFPDLHNSALILIGQFCDNGFEAKFNRQEVQILQNNHIVLRGPRDEQTGLWLIHLAPPTTTPMRLPLNTAKIEANSVYAIKRLGEIIQYLHQSCCSPVQSTWIKAIDAGYFTTWPNLTAELVRKHLPKSVATEKGHLRQQRQGLRSTQTNVTPTPIPNPMFSTTADEDPKVRTNWVYMKPIQMTGQIYSDQTGRFPVTSSRGNKYIMIVYDYDSNAILSEPLKSRTENELLRAYTKLHTYLTDRGLKPVLQKLDNEAPHSLKKFMLQQNIDFQLVPPHNHRRNAAKRAIAT